MKPRDACTKTGETVLDVLQAKNPEAHAPSDIILAVYHGRPPELVSVELIEDTVIQVARRLLGEAGSRGTDLVRRQYLLLQFGESSGKLRHIVVEFAECIAIDQPPWDAYHALMSGRLIGINNNPVVWPVGVV